MVNKFFLLGVVLLFCFVMVSAEPDFFFKQDTNSFLRIPCVEADESPCLSTEQVNITINYPNGSILVENNGSYYTSGGTFAYNLSSEQNSIPGIYTVKANKYTNNNSLAQFEYEVNGAGVKPSPERSSAQTRGVWVLFSIGALLFFAFIFIKMGLPARLTLLIFGIIFIVAGLNVVFITMREEAVSPELVSLFDGLSATSFVFLWFAGGLLIIIWFFTFYNTWLWKRNMKNFNRYGYNG